MTSTLPPTQQLDVLHWPDATPAPEVYLDEIELVRTASVDEAFDYCEGYGERRGAPCPTRSTAW